MAYTGGNSPVAHSGLELHPVPELKIPVRLSSQPITEVLTTSDLIHRALKKDQVLDSRVHPEDQTVRL